MSQKIGLITFHRANNLGAALQAYALFTYLNENICPTEIIDYYPNNAIPPRNTVVRRVIRKAKYILGGKSQIDRKRRYEKFDEFIKRCNLTERTYYGDKEINYNFPQYDLLISGSDQILNTVLTGNSEAYYLSFADTIPKISYASSFGRENISDMEKRYIKKYLDTFQSLSAREKSGKELIEKEINKNVELVVDPVFLLPRERWSSLAVSNDKQKYILVYVMENTPWLIRTVEKAQAYYKIPTKIVLGSPCSIPINGDVDNCCGPLEFLSYIKNAECVITNSFHGTAFSIIFRKKLLCVAHSSKNTRIQHLGNMCGFESKIITDNKISGIIETDLIDGGQAEKKIATYIENSKEYLKSTTSVFIKKDVESILTRNKCCGCGTCKYICKSKAITLIKDEWGFTYPTVDYDKCTQCGLCSRKCAVLNPPIRKEPKYIYAVRNKSEETVMASTSGGVFTALSDYILNRNGLVFGAVIDKDFVCRHISADNIIDRNKMRGAKYVQSEVNDSYEEVKNVLKQKKQVLFSGTPCQIAGLKSYLGSLNQENLITVDIVCHGVPSPKVFRDHIKWLEKKKDKIDEYSFRSKLVGWHGLNVNVLYKNGIRELNTNNVNAFSRLYFNSLITRECCYSCRYASIERVGDISISDFWTISKCSERFNDEKGTSCVFINTLKGQNLFNSVSDSLFIEEHTVAEAMQPNLYAPTTKSDDYDLFCKDYRRGIDYCIKKYTQGNLHYKIRHVFKAIKRRVL